MKKKILLTLSALMSLISGYASVTIDGLVYDLDIRTSTATIVYDSSYRNKTSVIIPKCITYNGINFTITGIGEEAFAACTSLTSITIPNSVKSIGDMAFCECTNLTSITIPNSVKSIGWIAFRACTSLTSITIPNSVTSIDSYAFDSCTNITSVVWNAKYCNFGTDLFGDITSKITSFSFGSEVESIPSDLCAGMCNLTSLHVSAKTPPVCGTNCFKDVPVNIPVYVSCDKETYSVSSGWQSFTNVIEVREYNAAVQQSTNGRVEIRSYSCDNELTILATADNHYHFVQWIDGSTDNPHSFIVFQDTMLTAWFAIDTHKISASAEKGHVEGVGEYDYGTTATLTAMADEHYHFVQWSDGNTDNPRTVSVNGDTIYSVVFVPNSYDISASAKNGRVDGAGSYDYGTTATLTAIADEHYHFVQWSDGNTDNPRTVSVNGDTIYSVVFVPNSYDISISAKNGRVDGAGSYDYGTTATLTAIADEHYHFVQWSDGNTDNPRTIMIDGDATYTAEFSIDQFTITAYCDIKCGEIAGNGVYDYGTQITLTAIPNSGYEFKQWSNGMTDNPYRFTVVSDLTLEAEFVSVTAIDHTSMDTNSTPQKILVDGQVYILRNGKTYTLTGVEVE